MGISAMEYGLSLIEFAISIFVLALILSLGGNVANLYVFNAYASEEANRLKEAIAFARQTAVLSNSYIVLCPLNSKKSCFNEWQQPITVFSDKNRNHRLDSEDNQLLNLPKLSDNSLVTYPRTAIVFDHRGFSGGYNGSLSYCRVSADVDSMGMSIIISRVGRIRFGADTNNNGLPELANGDEVPCKSYH